jgi:hypothetical protein
MDAAVAAEVMLSYARMKPVGGELAGAAQELEALRRDDEMKEPLLRADRAVALADAVEARGDAKAHAPAVAAALVDLHDPSPSSSAMPSSGVSVERMDWTMDASRMAGL